jgi:assimilatory nitrate reductase catalytic subunit
MPKQICNCLNVREDAILSQLKDCPGHVDPMVHLQQHLRCGTQCGSCRPEIQQLIHGFLKTAAVADAK